MAPAMQSGAGKVIRDLIFYSNEKLNAETLLVTSGEVEGSADWAFLLTELKKRNVTIRYVDLFHRESSRFWTSVKELEGIIADFNPDIIHSHAGVPALAGFLASAHLPVHRVVTFHGWGLNRPRWMDIQDVATFNLQDVVVTASDYFKDYLKGLGVREEKLHKIPLGIRPFSGVVPMLDFDRISKVSRIGLMGVIDPRKNQMAALEALTILKDRYSHPVELHLVGDIKDREYYLSLTQYIERSGLQGQVVFTGNLEAPLSYLAGMDIFLFVPVSEGFGLAVLEAMSLGLPVVSSYTEGAREFLEKGENFIEVDNRDPRSIAEGVMSLNGNRELIERLSKQSLKTAKKYDFKNSLIGYLRLYSSPRNTRKDTKK